MEKIWNLQHLTLMMPVNKIVPHFGRREAEEKTARLRKSMGVHRDLLCDQELSQPDQVFPCSRAPALVATLAIACIAARVPVRTQERILSGILKQILATAADQTPF